MLVGLICEFCFPSTDLAKHVALAVGVSAHYLEHLTLPLKWTKSLLVSDPVLSVNKLAEYIISRAARQRALLHGRKYPNPEFSVGMFHHEATYAIQRYLADGAIDPSVLENALNTLNQKTPDKIGTIRRINSNIERLERFGVMLDDIDLRGAHAEAGPDVQASMSISGVKISVRPEIILHGTGPKGQSLVGAIKLQLSGSSRFDTEAAGYVSAVVQEFCKRTLVRNGEIVHAPFCQVIDVANGIVYPGVKATTQRMKDVEAECLNIAALWPTI